MKTYTIGRDHKNQIVLKDNYVSRQHAQLIVLDNGQVILKDLGSSNGTFVNGNKITEVYLKAGDIVKCGGAFLNWTQYANVSPSFATNIADNNYQQESWNQDTKQSDIENTVYPQFSFGETWKYLTIKIFNVGDLFKTDWDRTPSILFFLLTPLVITIALLFSLYFNMQSQFQSGWQFNTQSHFPYQLLLLSVGTMILMFGASQFLTLSLMSVNRKMTASKILFASSIFSFLQFIPYLILIIVPASNFISKQSVFSNFDSTPGYFFLALLAITILISLLVTIIIFIYKYFRAIGVSKGISIHFTIITFTLNFLIQAILIYLFILIAKNSF